jgi:hypothetical protein
LSVVGAGHDHGARRIDRSDDNIAVMAAQLALESAGIDVPDPCDVGVARGSHGALAPAIECEARYLRPVFEA